MLTVTSLTIWFRWEQAFSGGSGFAGSGRSSFAGRGKTGFAGSKQRVVDLTSLVGVKLASLVAVDPPSLRGVKLASLGACW